MSENTIKGRRKAVPERMRASAWAPASLANFFHGFDAVGLALDGLRVRVTLEPAEEDAVLRWQDEDWKSVPKEKSISWWTVDRLRRRLGHDRHYTVRVESEIPPGVGLGSSAAMAVAAAKAYRRAVGGEGSSLWCRAAFEGEREFGGDHWDNVQPAFYGGLTVHDPTGGDRCRVLPAPRMRFVVIVPNPLLPRLPRDALPKQLAFADVVRSLTSLAWAMAAERAPAFENVADGIGSGPLESVRAKAIPYFEEASRLASTVGGRVFVSGGGPSIVAAVPSPKAALEVARRWEGLVRQANARLLSLKPLSPFAQEVPDAS